MRVLLTDTYLGDPSFEKALLEGHGIEMVVAPAATAETLASFDVDGMLNCVAKVPESVIESIPRLKVIARYGIGVDNIDVTAATRAGVLVCNVPDYATDEVATHALSMILSCARQLHVYHTAILNGAWEWRTQPELRRPSTLTVGVVGIGRIGSLLARKARAIGFAVVVHDPLVSDTDLEHLGVRSVGIQELLQESDFVSLHVPLTSDTTHLIDGPALALMKETAYLVNVGRGMCIDTAALIEALDSGLLAGAALDVFEEEPLPTGSPLIGHPKILHTPHSAWFSREALDEARRRAVANVVAAMNGKRPANLINPDAFAQRSAR